MKTIADLAALIQSGKTFVVTFAGGIDAKEPHFQDGMRAVAFAAQKKNDDIICVTFDCSNFEEHNRPLEPSIYDNADGRGTITARQAGCYSPIETAYFHPNEVITDYLTIEPDEALQLHEAFARDAAAIEGKITYVQWLERRTLELMKQVEQDGAQQADAADAPRVGVPRARM